MKRDDFKCLVCEDSESTLNVHHKSYANNPWETPNEDLETLCEWCHKQRTELNKLFNKVPSFEAMTFLDDFIRLTPTQLRKFYYEVVHKPRAPLDGEAIDDYSRRMRALERQWFGEGYER